MSKTINPLTGRYINVNSKIYKLLTNDTIFKNENNVLIPLNKKMYFYDEKKGYWLHIKFKKKQSKTESSSKPKQSKTESSTKPKILLLESEPEVKKPEPEAKKPEPEVKEKSREEMSGDEVIEDYNKEKKRDPTMTLFKYILRTNKKYYKSFILFLKKRKKIKEDYNKHIQESINKGKVETREHNNLFNRIKKSIDQVKDFIQLKSKYFLYDDLFYQMLLNMVNLSYEFEGIKSPLTNYDNFMHPDIKKERTEKFKPKPSDGGTNKYNILQEDYINLKEYLQ